MDILSLCGRGASLCSINDYQKSGAGIIPDSQEQGGFGGGCLGIKGWDILSTGGGKKERKPSIPEERLVGELRGKRNLLRVEKRRMGSTSKWPSKKSQWGSGGGGGRNERILEV